MEKDRTIKELFAEMNVSSNFFAELGDYIKRGDNKLLQTRIVETMIVDDNWVRIIENLIHSIEQIVKNPKKFIKEEELLVNVEKAKRMSPKTIRHLAANTNFIRAVDADGRIQPSKVLTREMREDLFIYENRFVNSLVIKLLFFVESRYKAIKDQIDTYDTTNLRMKSKFKLEGKAEVDYDVDIKIRKEPTSKVTLKKNYELLQKIEMLRKRVLIIKNSPFCRELAVSKLVMPPIMKTNIINMQTDYNNCYKLWMFISSYTAVGYSVEVSERKLPIDTDYYEDLTMLVAISLKTMLENNAVRQPLYKNAVAKKRRIRKFRELRRIEYSPSFRSKGDIKDSELINQFYFEQLKELIMDKEEIKATDFVNEKNLTLSFQKFYRGISKLTNEMYHELLSISTYTEPLRLQTALQKKQFEVRKQIETCKKLQIISRLKADDLLKTLKKENTQKIRLERMKFQLETLKAKDKKKKPTKDALSTVTTKSVATKKMKTVLLRAQQDEKTRMNKELNRQKKQLEKHKLKKKGVTK